MPHSTFRNLIGFIFIWHSSFLFAACDEKEAFCDVPVSNRSWDAARIAEITAAADAVGANYEKCKKDRERCGYDDEICFRAEVRCIEKTKGGGF